MAGEAALLRTIGKLPHRFASLERATPLQPPRAIK
jgi:hypothetical protein